MSAVESVSARLDVTVATSAEDLAFCKDRLEAEHSLGDTKAAGHRLWQIVRREGVPVAVVVWAASALRLKDRDAWIGWDTVTRAKRLKLVVNNTRFLVLDETREPNLASQSLGAALRALPIQWQAVHGFLPLLAESFTDIESHSGTTYKATNWIALGHSKGFARHRADYYIKNDRPKKLWIFPLHPEAKDRLCARQLPPEHAAAETVGADGRCALKVGQLRSLSDVFAALPDDRTRDSVRYPLRSLLSIISMALLCGAASIKDIHRLAQRLTQPQRAAIGLRRRGGKNANAFYPVPCANTYTNILARIDHRQLAHLLTLWISAQHGHLPRTLALDGKNLRDKLGMLVSLVDTRTGTPIAMAVAPDAGAEARLTAELLGRPEVELSGATVSADALHCQIETACTIVMDKGGDYILSVKNNQPTLLQTVQHQLENTPPLFRKMKKATDASSSANCAP
ncbi:MAG: ISAs1 family transposase [Verrucomicrobiales bacterium]